MFQCKEQDFDLLDVDRELVALELQGNVLSPMAEAGSVIVTDLNRQIETGAAAVIFTYGEEQLAGIVSNIRDRSSGKLQGYMIHSLAPEDDNTRMISKADVFCAAPILATYADPEIFREQCLNSQPGCDKTCDCAPEGGLSGDNAGVNDAESGRVAVKMSFGATFADFFLTQGAVLVDTTTRDRFRHRDGVLQWMLSDGRWTECHYGSLTNRARHGYDQNRFVYDDVLTADRQQLTPEQADRALQGGALITDIRSNDQFRVRDGTLYVRAGTENPWEQARYTRLSDVEEPAGRFFVVGSTLSDNQAVSA